MSANLVVVCGGEVRITALRKQAAVTAYFSREQLLLFAFARQYTRPPQHEANSECNVVLIL